MNFKIYNKSSENMNELEKNSVDLIVCSPPYNLETKYGEFEDSMTFEQYLQKMKKIIAECDRVLKNDGQLIVEVADAIFDGENFIELANLFQKLALENDLSLESRNINFISSENKIIKKDHGFNYNFLTKTKAHTNCHQILVFRKGKPKISKEEILYMNYLASKEHSCPWPKEIYNFYIKNYYKKGMVVLDPFMGLANLGKEVIKNNGKFIGYEISKDIFNKAKINLESK